MKRLFTSESVTEGHPDKICDQISDGILDFILSKDPLARVACEVSATTGIINVMGEITTSCYVDIQSLVRSIVNDIGYNKGEYGFDCNTCAIANFIHGQSPDIAVGVNESFEKRNDVSDENQFLGAGDQGIMFGYATNETEEYMPLPIVLAHKLSKRLSEVRKLGILNYLRPDGKTQVTVEYDGDVPVRIDTILISTQHDENTSQDTIKKDLMEHVIKSVIPENLLDDKVKYFVNPTGRFVIGGPHGDSGLTGRKIIVDTYGGFSRHGGGAFSGKDPTKVDRTAAYGARWVAKNIVASGICDKIEIQLAYAIGVANPVSLFVETFGTEKVSKSDIYEIINKVFDLSPGSLIENLDLRRPIYRQVSSYGHFGRNDLDLPWERLDKVDEIKVLINK
ncbi:methionine adenosyltransferase [Candidatus Arthromitus sp. SFB-turkey]|uniref:methionine adenosyltransferase n=1 Tax=Candidatus Arthromitus sp. SFB-turkey TaxID=1840217 RepID=UPI0007F3B9A5|nr:methionine adenosyltransferase [Candidatus Arthromitus sp. SFB-turkey]OAT90004.1 methionine adenosyltransferase [Candidatus Arthromitus sp. SFB-turkey]HJD00487.1 methionine adenosyltransferase [Candidatus Dwaynia gallinarum]